MNRKQIKEIKLFLKKLEEDFNLPKYDYDIDCGTDEVYLKFPYDEDELTTYHVQELNTYYDEIDSLQIVDDNKVISDKLTQRVIEINKQLFYYLYLGLFENHLDNGIIIRIRDSPLLIGLAAVKLKQYDKYNAPCSKHTAVEIIYPNKEARLSDQEENDLLNSYFFEIANFYKVSIKFSSFHLMEHDYSEDDNYFLNIKRLDQYNIAMELFIKANSSLSEDLRYLFYYQILEYFAPIYSKIASFELLKNKLDNVQSHEHNSEYLNSFFELAKKFDISLRDKELVKSLINSTFDLVDIYMELPDSIRSRKIKTKNITYKTKKDSIDNISSILGDILYSTRNQIVHAKSNYTPNGLECAEDDFEQLNNFMHKACYAVIKWYTRLPDYQK